MSEAPVVRITLPWEEATFLEGAELWDHLRLRRSPKRYLGPLFLLLALLGLGITLETGSVGLFFAGTLLSIYWYLVRGRVRKKELREQFARAELAGKPLKVRADASGLRVDGAPIPWEAVRGAVATERGYLLLIDTGFLWFPRKLFADDGDRRAFGNLLAEHLLPFEKWNTHKG
jgi:hypothetical protein